MSDLKKTMEVTLLGPDDDVPDREWTHEIRVTFPDMRELDLKKMTKSAKTAKTATKPPCAAQFIFEVSNHANALVLMNSGQSRPCFFVDHVPVDCVDKLKARFEKLTGGRATLILRQRRQDIDAHSEERCNPYAALARRGAALPPEKGRELQALVSTVSLCAEVEASMQRTMNWDDARIVSDLVECMFRVFPNGKSTYPKPLRKPRVEKSDDIVMQVFTT